MSNILVKETSITQEVQDKVHALFNMWQEFIRLFYEDNDPEAIYFIRNNLHSLTDYVDNAYSKLVSRAAVVKEFGILQDYLSENGGYGIDEEFAGSFEKLLNIVQDCVDAPECDGFISLDKDMDELYDNLQKGMQEEEAKAL